MSDRDRGRDRGQDWDGGGGRGRSDRSDSRPRGGPEDKSIGNTTSLLVRNISYRVRAEELRSIFSRFGDVRDVYIPQDYYTRKARGFAFIEFYNRRDAADAVDNLERHLVDGREISVVFAKDRRKTPDEMRPRTRPPPDYSRDRMGGDRGGGRRHSSRSRSRDRGGGPGGYRDYNDSGPGYDRYDDRMPDRRSPVPRGRSPTPDRRGGDSPPPRRRDTPPASRSPSPRPAQDN